MMNEEILLLLEEWERGADADFYDRDIARVREALKNTKKQECETCAAKRKRLMDAGFLKSPLRGEDHVD
jgi:hypothetical protein